MPMISGGEHPAITHDVLHDGSELVRSDRNVGLFEIKGVIQQLESLEVQLREELAGLPELGETLQFEAYGYHGGYLPALDEIPEEPRWTLEFMYGKYLSLEKVILVPAVDHRFGQLGSYGFPRRFRVLSVAKDGRQSVIKEWMDRDFADPGRFPLIIDVEQPGVHIVRLEVYRGALDGGREVFALDEFFGVKGVGTHIVRRVQASSNFESPPYWGLQFITDQRASLGLPLDYQSGKEVPEQTQDFSVSFDRLSANGCMLELDLGQNRKLGWVTLYPAQPQGDIRIPGYGFPGKIKLELAMESATGERGEFLEPLNPWEPIKPGNNIVRIPGSGDTGRWVRIYFDELAIHGKKPTFAMGEVQVDRLEKTYPISAITLNGFPEEAEQKVHLLMDGLSGGYPCLHLVDWLHRIERQNLLSTQLDDILNQKELLSFRMKRSWRLIGYTALILVALVAIGLAVLEFIQHRRASNRVRLQISSDLHDDVGSTLGSISMTAEQLEKMDLGESAGKILHDLSLMSREACASLREVIWVADKTHTHLPDLIQKLVERAERVLDGTELEIHVPSDIPNLIVSLNTKRHFIMFYKEALHNCIRHAQASTVTIAITIVEEMLAIMIRDDGCGFDTAGSFLGWGLNTMQKRAKELHGNVEINSQVGAGTSVTLSMPLKALSTEPKRAYKTSN